MAGVRRNVGLTRVLRAGAQTRLRFEPLEDRCLLNAAPYAYGGSFSAIHDQSISGWVYGYDPEADPLTYALVTWPSHYQSFSFASAYFEYTPEEHYVGDDSFTFKVKDGIADSATAKPRATPSTSGPAITTCESPPRPKPSPRPSPSA